MIILEETKKNKHTIMIDPEAQAFNYFEKNLVRKLDDQYGSGLPSIVLQLANKKSTEILKHAMANG